MCAYVINYHHVWGKMYLYVYPLIYALYRHWEKELERKAKGKEPRLWVPVWCLIWPRLLLQCSVAAFAVRLVC